MSGKRSLGTLLSTLGLLMTQASRRSKRFKSQVTGNVVVEITSSDGAAHHYVFTDGRREMESRRGRAPGPADVSVNFESGLLGVACLSRPDAVGQIYQGMLDRKVTIDGNPVLLLWFYGLTRLVLPVGRQKAMRHPLPGALLEPNPSSVVAGRITREPAVASLDTSWAGALERRAQMVMVRACDGEPVANW